LEKIIELREEKAEIIKKQIWENSKKIFKIKNQEN
jgi:Tat protein secretion system quality control protein TatD with DNase activity